jgi:hypothetical protein
MESAEAKSEAVRAKSSPRQVCPTANKEQGALRVISYRLSVIGERRKKSAKGKANVQRPTLNVQRPTLNGELGAGGKADRLKAENLKG